MSDVIYHKQGQGRDQWSAALPNELLQDDGELYNSDIIATIVARLEIQIDSGPPYQNSANVDLFFSRYLRSPRLGGARRNRSFTISGREPGLFANPPQSSFSSAERDS